MACTYCENKKIEEVLSVTNTVYTLCDNCKGNVNQTNKHLTIDALLKKLLDQLKFSKGKSLKIEVTQNSGLISLAINDINIFRNDFNYKLIHKEIYFLENTISDLIEDHYEADTSKVDILVCA